MPQINSLFVTRLYRAALSELGLAPTPEQLEDTCLGIAEDDTAGQNWCEEHRFPGYTSYASLDDLAWRDPLFKDLVRLIDKHVAAFAQDLAFDLDGKKLTLDSIWINILPQGGIHTSHIHPHSVISGTTYVAVPSGSGALKLEDPRLPMMMAAPTRTKDAPEGLQNFIFIAPEPGEIVMWESWLRHEVPMNMATEDRISISFNYGWG